MQTHGSGTGSLSCLRQGSVQLPPHPLPVPLSPVPVCPPCTVSQTTWEFQTPLAVRTPAPPILILHVAVLIFSTKGKNSLQDHKVGPSQAKCVPNPDSKHQERNGETQGHGQLCQRNTNLTATHSHLSTRFPRVLGGHVSL